MRKEKRLSQTRESTKVTQNHLRKLGRRQSGTVRNMSVERGRASSHSSDHTQPSGRSHSLCHVSASRWAWLAAAPKIVVYNINKMGNSF